MRDTTSLSYFLFKHLCLPSLSSLASSYLAQDFSILGFFFINFSEDLTHIDEDIACFESWALKHKRVYESMEEMLHRFEVFKGALKFIERTNKENRGYTVGLNNFSDLTREEFLRRYTMSSDYINRPPPSISSRGN